MNLRALSAVLMFTFALLFSLGNAFALNPDEVLSDPKLERRAREISAGLRCMVCQNESIDDSNAELARDLRILVRERLSAGDTDKEVRDFVVARYGEFVLLKPRLSGNTLLLWGFPIVILLIGGGTLLFSLSRRKAVAPQPLSGEEKARLSKILDNK